MTRRDAIEAIAADWAVRMAEGSLSAGRQAELENWLAQDPEHRAALDFALSTWSDLGRLRLAPGALLQAPPPRRARPWPQAAALAASLLLAALLGLWWFGDPRLGLLADARTAPGETRLLTLADGSEVELGPDSALAEHYDGRTRRVELLAGRAYFAPLPVAAAGGRPFVVEAAGGSATALGTRFVVDRQDDHVTVTVAEHQVAVATAGSEAVLSPGQAVRYGEEIGRAHV